MHVNLKVMDITVSPFVVQCSVLCRQKGLDYTIEKMLLRDPR